MFSIAYYTLFVYLPPMNPKEYKSVSQYARLKGCSISWIYKLINEKKIKPEVIGGLKLISLKEYPIKNHL